MADIIQLDVAPSAAILNSNDAALPTKERESGTNQPRIALKYTHDDSIQRAFWTWPISQQTKLGTLEGTGLLRLHYTAITTDTDNVGFSVKVGYVRDSEAIDKALNVPVLAQQAFSGTANALNTLSISLSSIFAALPTDESGWLVLCIERDNTIGANLAHTVKLLKSVLQLDFKSKLEINGPILASIPVITTPKVLTPSDFGHHVVVDTTTIGGAATVRLPSDVSTVPVANEHDGYEFEISKKGIHTVTVEIDPGGGGPSTTIRGLPSPFTLPDDGNSVRVRYTSYDGTYQVFYGSGESNTGFNVGSGVGKIFRDKTNNLLNLKSIKAGTDIIVTNNADDITITANVAAGVSGSGVLNQMTFWDGPSSISSSNQFSIDRSTVNPGTPYTIRFILTNYQDNGLNGGYYEVRTSTNSRAQFGWDATTDRTFVKHSFQATGAKIEFASVRGLYMQGIQVCGFTDWWKSRGLWGRISVAGREVLNADDTGNVGFTSSLYTEITHIRKSAFVQEGGIIVVNGSQENVFGATHSIIRHDQATVGSDVGIWLAGQRDRILHHGESITFVLQTVAGGVQRWVELTSSNPQPRILSIGGYVGLSTNIMQTRSVINLVANDLTENPTFFVHSKGMASPRSFTGQWPGLDDSAILATNRGSNDGGYQLQGLSSNVASAIPALYGGIHGHTAPTVPAVVLRGGKTNTTGGAQTLANTEILAQFRNWSNVTDVINIFGDGSMSIGGVVQRELLHLSKSSAVKSAARFTNSVSGNGATDGFEAALLANGVDAHVWNYEAGKLIFGTNNGELFNVDNNGIMTFADAKNIATGTTTGTKIGTLTTQKIGFWNATPITQPSNTAAITNITGTANDALVAVSGSGDDANINDNFADVATKINAILTLLQNTGLMA